MNKDEIYMLEALKQAEKAKKIDEVPVGAVIVKDDKIISRGFNKRERKNDPLGHAEIICIKKANKKLRSWRLEDCTIYVTIEPCLMCAGTLLQTRIKRIVYGAPDLKGGALGSSINIFDAKNINHHPDITGGILKEQCSSIMSTYFKEKRK